MADSMKQEWGQVAEGFSALGRLMKERYQATAEAGEQAGAEADAAVRDAFHRLADAAREVGDRLGDVVRDDDVKAQAKGAMASFDHAISETVALITSRLNAVFTSEGDGSEGGGTQQPPSDPAEREPEPPNDGTPV